MCIFTILQLSLFLLDYGFNFFHIVVVNRPDSTCLNLNGANNLWFVIWVDLFPQKRCPFVYYLLWGYIIFMCIPVEAKHSSRG
jgi:hypothetical protein